MTVARNQELITNGLVVLVIVVLLAMAVSMYMTWHMEPGTVVGMTWMRTVWIEREFTRVNFDGETENYRETVDRYISSGKYPEEPSWPLARKARWLWSEHECHSAVNQVEVLTDLGTRATANVSDARYLSLAVGQRVEVIMYWKNTVWDISPLRCE